MKIISLRMLPSFSYIPPPTNIIPSVHHVPDGKASRKNWTEWDTDGFRIGVARSFKKYIKFMGKDYFSIVFRVSLMFSTLETIPASNHNHNHTASAAAGPDPTSTAIAFPSHRPQPDTTATMTAVTAPKRTAAGRYKCRPIVYSEGGDSDEWSDHSNSEEGSQKRPRTDVVMTRSQSRLSEGIDDSSRETPPDNSTLLQSPVSFGARDADPFDNTPIHSPVQSGAHGVDPLDNPPINPPTSRSPDRGIPCVGGEDLGPALGVARNRDPHSSTTPVIEKNAPSNTTSTDPPSIANDADTAATPPAGDTSSEVSSRTTPTVIPSFLTVAPKKNKESVYNYLASCEDFHFQELLQAYIDFEKAAVTLGVTGSLSTTGRPSQISSWIRSARPSALPQSTNLREYGSSVVAWWYSLQPSWRKLGCGTPSREDGEFDCLLKPGINGLVNVVILAYWWSNFLAKFPTDSEAEGSRYRWFVTDVSWVLSKLLETAQSE